MSIPSNIAEGYGQNSNNEFNRFLKVFMGSLFEL
ncbi:four helix bundle protein [Fodinibius halophilus]|uniref:Four helix bundle protein n=1 Tax=Fodinibius halophilus TaxID=1736908 RepID=A0A6M1T539_9BACT|nr:four helix bundle protein [Fodinibius halophilus]